MKRTTRQWLNQLLHALVVGVAAGRAATAMEGALHYGIEHGIGQFAPSRPPIPALAGSIHWPVLLLPALGGLISALMTWPLGSADKGHGTDTLIRAYHRNHGDMALAPAATKATAAVSVIASGGSAGPEGPIAALGAAIGSTLARWFGAAPRERRILLLAGCAAGVGAIFRCPLGGALFAVGILYSEPEYESEAIIPCVFASITSYSIFIGWRGVGERLLQRTEQLTFASPSELLVYALLGVLCGLTCLAFSWTLSAVDRARRVAPPHLSWATPVAGGLLTGLLACLVPAVIDNRYVFIQQTMDLDHSGLGLSAWGWAGAMALVLVAKLLATSCTVGSGACGGALGPSLFLGGAAGALLGAVLQAALPGGISNELRQSLIPVGMGGVLAAGMRIPLASLVMVTEMTGGYALIVPLMLVCTSSYLIGRRSGLNHEQVPTRAESPVHIADSVLHQLESWSVRDLMTAPWPHTLSPRASLPEIIARIPPGSRPVFAVLKGEQLVGLISLPDLERLMREADLASIVIAHDIMSTELVTAGPEDDVYHALELFRREDHNVLPVVDDHTPPRFLGMLTRRRIYESLSQQVEASRRVVLREFRGLAAVEQEAQLDHLVSAVAPRHEAQIERLSVPPDALGRSLREAEVRRVHGIQVVAIELATGDLQAPPDLDMPLAAEHRLVALRTPPRAPPNR